MNDEPRQKLRELIVEYGRSLCNDPDRCEALLKDYCGIHKREIFVLVSALRKKVADDMLKSSAGVPSEVVMARLQKRLEDELAMTAEASNWAVESWALALGFITIQSPFTAPTSHAKVLPVVPQEAIAVPPATKQETLVAAIRARREVIRAAPAKSDSQQQVASSPITAATHLMAGRYRDNSDGTVTDLTTGLQWMRFSLGQEWKGESCGGKANTYKWNDAIDAAKNLNYRGGYAGRQDWRVPTKEELLSLVYSSSGLPKTWNDSGGACKGNYAKPTIYQQAFPNTPSAYFWTRSLQAGIIRLGWYVMFDNGGADCGFKNVIGLRVRLVRN